MPWRSVSTHSLGYAQSSQNKLMHECTTNKIELHVFQDCKWNAVLKY